MKASSFAASAALLASAAVATPSLQPRASGASSASIPTITVKGNAFWAGNDRFYVRGVDYQPGGSSAKQDPIADAAGCARDIKKFVDLGLNTIRVYMVDNTLNHDACMNALAAAGIYLALDVNTPDYSIRRDLPHPSYNDVYLQSLFATVDAFAKYPNTLLFFSGNEVINDNTTTGAAPYVKAVTRDLRQYIRARKYRQIPVGYSAADVDSNRFEMANYMNCGSDDERSDFFAFNDYSWCDPSTYQQSGWQTKVSQYGSYSLPLFLSEYGCNTGASGRQFQEVASLYSDDMSPVYSGGLVYEYSQEESNFGLVDLSGSSPENMPDYSALKTALAKTPSPTGDGGYKSDGTASQCPPESPTWNVTSDALPAMPNNAVQYMTKGAGTGPGLNGPGSQDAGTASTGTAAPGSASSTASPGAAAGLNAPGVFEVATVVCGLVVAVSTLFGAALL